MLRQPWQQVRGSEKDELEKSSTHVAAILNNTIIAVGRIHISNQSEAQIRYMAVDETYQSKGIGRLILKYLEQAATEQNSRVVFLHARENALAFYKKNQYQLIKPSHMLYGKIKHFLMKKTLSD